MGGSRFIRLGLALAALAVSAQVATAATPEQIRDCVERNLVRYSDPETAVAAQYADIETACIAALSGSGISAEFVGDGPTTTPAPAAGADGTPKRASDTLNTPANGQPAPTPVDASGRGRPAVRDGTPSPAARESTEALVAQAIAETDASSSSPLPSGLGGVSTGMGLLLAGAAALIVGAAGISIRKRKN